MSGAAGDIVFHKLIYFLYSQNNPPRMYLGNKTLANKDLQFKSNLIFW